MRMRAQFAKFSLIFTAVAVCLALGVLVTNRPDKSPKTTAETTASVLSASEQVDDPPEQSIEPDVNNLEFRLHDSTVSCPTSTAADGSVSRSCSGNIRVIPRAQADMEPGLYKVDTQTRLLHEGAEQDLATLPQLVQSDTVVRLQLAEGSSGVLATITY